MEILSNKIINNNYKFLYNVCIENNKIIVLLHVRVRISLCSQFVTSK